MGFTSVLLQGKQGIIREIMHDDSGAQTGLRTRPDYGESDAYTTETNEENAKGASVGYVVAMDSSVAKIAASGEMYVTAVEYDPKNNLKITKFTFNSDRTAAKVFPRLTAENLSHQINSPAFGAKSHVVLAYNYEEMFKALEKLVPKAVKEIKNEITWGKQVLKKQDRIIWYLRWYRLALMQHYVDWGNLKVDAEPEPIPANVGPGRNAAVRTEPATTQPPALEQQPSQQAKPLSIQKQKQNLLVQYVRDLETKGATKVTAPHLDDFPVMKQQLEHYYSMPVPDIQNRALKAESPRQVLELFSAAEYAYREQRKKLIQPKPEDKVWMKFPDGWAWWHLPRCSCPDESKAMGHCGNSPRAGEKDCSILSLRQPRKIGKETLWEPHLTFILNGSESVEEGRGVLGEMKGKNNDKPIPAYHKYIIPLLQDERIESVAGGGYRPENNFAMKDLTNEQRAEVAKTNPYLSLNVEDYYRDHGMDERLAKRVGALLGLSSSTYDSQYGFVLRKWKDEEDFINDCGDRDAKEAIAFLNGDKAMGPSEPSAADLLSFVEDDGYPITIENIGIGLMYYHPKEQRERHPNYNPKESEHVIEFLTQLLEPSYTGDKAEWLMEEETDKENQKERRKKFKYPTSKVLDMIRQCYNAGVPDTDSIASKLNASIEYAIEQERDNTSIERSGEAYLQLLEDEVAVSMAAQYEKTMRGAPRFDEPSISLDNDWDEWNEEYASSELNKWFEIPPSRPAFEDKRQKRLFTEPKTEEEAKRKGITVSSMKSPLLRPSAQI